MLEDIIVFAITAGIVAGLFILCKFVNHKLIDKWKYSLPICVIIGYIGTLIFSDKYGILPILGDVLGGALVCFLFYVNILVCKYGIKHRAATGRELLKEAKVVFNESKATFKFKKREKKQKNTPTEDVKNESEAEIEAD
jgi:hypothetical protein